MDKEFSHMPGPTSGDRDRTRGFVRRYQRFLWLALAVAAALAFVWWLKPAGDSGAQSRFRSTGPTPVGVAVAARADVQVVRSGLGTVTPLATVNVRPQVGGIIVKINFAEGQHVKAGEVLAEIDPRPYRAALDQAKASLDRDLATLQNAKTDLARYQALAKANAVSAQQLATQQTTVKQDVGVVEADRASVETAALNLGYTRITSPVTGLVGLRQVDLGNLVTAGQSTNIAVVTQMQPMSVLFTVPEDDIDAIRAAMRAGGALTAEAYDRADANLIARGRLGSIDNVVDVSTGTVKLRAMFDNEDGALFPNQFVNIHLRVRTLRDQTTVPAAAIQQGAQGNYVFVVYPGTPKTAHLRAVTVGVSDGGVVQILAGLKPGDTVVTDGADRLSEGAPVTLPDAKTLAVAKPSAADAPLPPDLARRARGRGVFALMRKLTPAERTQLRGMSRDDREAWLKAHKDELEKRPDQPGSDASGSGRGSHGRIPH